jgi:hypothetical protein
MEALIAAFLESLKAEAAAGAVAAPAAEAVVAAAPAAPMSLGDTLGGFAQNQIKEQISPAMDLYKGITNPNASMGDMARSAFKYEIKKKEDDNPFMAPQMGNSYGGMANNYVGGIPSILQNTNSGILPYIGGR